MLVDGVLMLAAGGLYWLATADRPPPLSWLQALTTALVMAISFTWMMNWTGSYRVERYGRFWRSLVDLIRAYMPAVAAATVLLLAFVPLAWQHRSWFEATGIVIFVTLILGRRLDHLLVRQVERRALLVRRVAVVGVGPMADAMVAQLQSSRYVHDYELVGVFDPQFDTLRPVAAERNSDPTTRADLLDYAQNYAVDLVVIALPWERSTEIFALIRRLQWIAADVVVPFETGSFRPQFVPPIGFIGAPILQVMHRPFKGSQGLLKVMEDYVVATIGLICVSPFMLAAAVAIKLEGSGPIIFRQARVGFNSKPFMMYKFRTMTVDLTDDGSKGTTRDNQRVTRVGRFLRRSSIDELPQLFNVLLGEMSIVGPRPHVANMLVGTDVYTDIVRQYAARHRIKPGITGWAQINGMRGGIDSLAKANRGADLDLYYIANWSLRLDIKIMFRTIFRGLAGRDVF